MEERNCLVVFNESTGRVTGQIRDGIEVVKELSFYLGKLYKTEPAVVEEMIRSRYQDWAKVNGVSEIQIEYAK
ncbi:MAG TPA: hypothetical protein VI958_06760 [Acidobacteriota bacterium]